MREFQRTVAPDNTIGLLKGRNKTGFDNRQPAIGKSQGSRDMGIDTLGVVDGLGLDFDRFGAHQPARDTNPVAADIQKRAAPHVLF